jgi:RNA polymerase-binding protein DksA
VVKSNRTPVKKTSRSAGATAARSKRAASPRASAKTTKRAAASPGKVNGTPVAARSAKNARKPVKVTEKPAKAAKAASRGKSRSPIDVKVGSFGGNKPGSFGFGGSGGASFLSGKPGSSGMGGSGTNAVKLTRTKLGARDLRHFRELLLTKRRQLLGDMETMENEALRTETSNLSHLPVHMADMGTDNYEQEFTLSLVDRDRQMVDEIDVALRKIDEKTYGICEGTGQMISRERLEAKPWARYSIEYARHLQRPGVRR